MFSIIFFINNVYLSQIVNVHDLRLSYVNNIDFWHYKNEVDRDFLTDQEYLFITQCALFYESTLQDDWKTPTCNRWRFRDLS